MSEHKVGDLLLGFDYRRRPYLGYICEILDGQHVIDWIEIGRATASEVDIEMFKNNLRNHVDKP